MIRRVAIIGAGMAGLACADMLVTRGLEVSLFDKGRGPGGRLSTRRAESSLGALAFDHGAPGFDARDPEFVRQLEAWRQTGSVDRWPACGPDAWVGIPSMNAVVKALAGGHSIRWNARVERLERATSGWQLHLEGTTVGLFDAVLLAIPADQAEPLIAPHDATLAESARMAVMDPCWSAMFAFAEPLPLERDVYRSLGVVDLAVRNSAKPGRRAPEAWVVQATAEWSRSALEWDQAAVIARLSRALSDILGNELPTPVFAAAHRWRYASVSTALKGPYWNPLPAIGACGDWVLGSGVEAAWRSGRELAAMLAADGLPRAALSGSAGS